MFARQVPLNNFITINLYLPEIPLYPFLNKTFDAGNDIHGCPLYQDGFLLPLGVCLILSIA